MGTGKNNPLKAEPTMCSTMIHQHDNTADGSARDALERLEGVLQQCVPAAAAGEVASLLQELRGSRDASATRERTLRATEAQIESSRDHFARLFDLSPIGYLVLDAAGRVRQSNLTVERLLGCDRIRLTGQRFAGLLVPGDRRELLKHLRRVLAGGARPGKSETLLARLASETGEPRVVRLVSTMQHGEEGSECLAAVIDVTARVEAERERIRSERLRQSVLDALPAHVAVLAKDGRIVSVNEGCRRFAEQNEGSAALTEGEGLNYLAACRKAAARGDAEAGRVADGIAGVLDRRAERFVHTYPCSPPGGVGWFELTSVPIEGDGDGAIVMHFDITARKLAEDRARRARESTARAARANAVGILATSLLHEIAQPLSAAGFFTGTAASMLQQGNPDPDKLAKLMASLDTQIRRAAEILQRLRDFLRARELRVEPVGVDAVVEGALGLVRWFASDRCVRVLYAQQAPGVMVAADALQVEQVLVNLICNGIEAIDDAGTSQRDVFIEIEPGSAHVEIIVRDSGPGISPESRDRLFNIFMSTKATSLGMGLAISRDIVEAHGGKLWADPESTEGAVVRFTLPRAIV
jgi:PAS domain S-box-containing protein